MKEKSPAFQWYPKDALASQRMAMMTLAEEGAYRRALDYCWINGALPADIKALVAIIGKGCSKKTAETVKAMFVERDGLLYHERLDSERDKQRLWREKSARGGKISAEKRKAEGSQTATTLQPPLQNGGHQNATLQFSFSSASSGTSTNFIKIKGDKFFLKASEWLQKNKAAALAGFLKGKKMDVAVAFAKLDAEYVQYSFNDENHVFNTFKKICAALEKKPPALPVTGRNLHLKPGSFEEQYRRAAEKVLSG